MKTKANKWHVRAEMSSANDNLLYVYRLQAAGFGVVIVAMLIYG